MASLTSAIVVVAYIQSKPNTTGVAVRSSFDGKRAFTDLEKLAGFGPRPSGSPALERTREFIADRLRVAGNSLTEDRFTASTPLGPIPMVNLIARIPGSPPLVIILAGHYDTKRMVTPFVGANDGGSSAAFLLEVARVLIPRPNRVTYWLVFFDGEEAVQRWSRTGRLYGSRHFARILTAQGMQNKIRVVFVVDMIANAHLDVDRESHSTPWLTDIVFAQARDLSYRRYFLDSPRSVEDDHLPFVKLGIPAVDIIDLDYGPFNLYWHSRFDAVDKCNANSLAVVGDTVLRAVRVLETMPWTALVGTPDLNTLLAWTSLQPPSRCESPPFQSRSPRLEVAPAPPRAPVRHSTTESPDTLPSLQPVSFPRPGLVRFRPSPFPGSLAREHRRLGERLCALAARRPSASAPQQRSMQASVVAVRMETVERPLHATSSITALLLLPSKWRS